MAAKKEKMVVRAVASFADALTGKTFRPHEVVEGWDEERALFYQERGLVEVVHAPEAADPQMTIDEAPGPETAKEETGKPGPKETKPKSGGTVKK